MEPVALRVQPTTAFDPFAAAQKGMQLGQMGLQMDQLRQQLVTQQLEQERARQLIQTEAIGQQEAQRALDLRRREDFTRRTKAEVMAKHQKKGAEGRVTTDYDAAYQELVGRGDLEPGTLEDLRTKVLNNKSAALKTSGDAQSLLKQQVIDDARLVRGMSERQAEEFLNRAVNDTARATGLPLEDVKNRYATTLRMQPGASLVKNAQGIVAAYDINEAQRIQNQFTQTQLAQAQETITQAGLAGMTGPAARDKNSPITQAARVAFLQSLGPDADPKEIARINTLSAAEIYNMPGGRQIIEGNIKGPGTRAEVQQRITTSQTEMNQLRKLEQLAQRVKANKSLPEVNPINIISNQFDQNLMLNADFAAYANAVREADRLGIQLDVITGGPSGVAAVARSEQKLRQDNIKTLQQNLTSGKFSTAVPGAAPGAQPARPPAPPGTVYLQDASGKVSSKPVPIEIARQVLKDNPGYKRVE